MSNWYSTVGYINYLYYTHINRVVICCRYSRRQKYCSHIGSTSENPTDRTFDVDCTHAESSSLQFEIQSYNFHLCYDSTFATFASL